MGLRNPSDGESETADAPQAQEVEAVPPEPADTEAKGTKGTSARRAGWVSEHKVFVAVALGVVLGVGVGGAYVALSSPTQDQTSTQTAEAPVEEVSGETTETSGEADATASDASGDATADASGSSDEAEQEASATDPAAMADAYGRVLDAVEAGEYDFTNPDEPGIQISPDSFAEFTYAVHDVDGDGIPELLVQCPGMDSSYSTSVNQQNMLAFKYGGGSEATELSGVVSLRFTSSGSHVETEMYEKSGNGGIYKRAFDSVGYIAGSALDRVSDPMDPTAANTYRYTLVTVEVDALTETDLGSSIPDDVGSIVTFTSIGDRSQFQQIEL